MFCSLEKTLKREVDVVNATTLLNLASLHYVQYRQKPPTLGLKNKKNIKISYNS